MWLLFVVPWYAIGTNSPGEFPLPSRLTVHKTDTSLVPNTYFKLTAIKLDKIIP